MQRHVYKKGGDPLAEPFARKEEVSAGRNILRGWSNEMLKCVLDSRNSTRFVLYSEPSLRTACVRVYDVTGKAKMVARNAVLVADFQVL